MKTKNILLYAGIVIAYIWWMKKKKSSVVSKNAAETAKEIVANAVDQTTFLPDTTTFADLYAKDKSECK